jgi:hypothetical protein
MNIFQKTILMAALPLGAVMATSTSADQLCQGDGTGCMNISWSCDSFATPADLMCVSTITSAKVETAKRETLNGAVELPDVAKDIATLRKRKAKMLIILPDPKVKQMGTKPLN